MASLFAAAHSPALLLRIPASSTSSPHRHHHHHPRIISTSFAIRRPLPFRRLPLARASSVSHHEPQQLSISFGEEQTPLSSSSSDDDRRIQNIVVVGGGTAGWMTASYLAKALGDTASVTVLQAPDISSLGVGEATIPDLQVGFFDFLGIPETEWMPECNGSFKMAVKYINWRTPGPPSPTPRRCTPDGSKNLHSADYFYNLFAQNDNHCGLPLTQYWVNDVLDKSSPPPPPFMYACFDTAPALDANLSPRLLDGTPAAGSAWHFDAHLVADFLRRHSTAKLGVRHVQERMVRVELDPRRPGHIQALHTAAGSRLPADLFIDCTGFRGLLINGVQQEPFLPSDHLLCDSAVATQVPHDDAANGVEPYTSAIAMDSGWTWKIPMLGRFGTGYVYSSVFATEERATEDFLKLWDLDGDKTKLNKIRFRVGRNRRAWVGNVVSIGAASCFLEPLESSGIYFIYTALYHLMQNFPDKDFREGCSRRFNGSIESMFLDMQDFLQIHFCFSPRSDTPFWEASRELESKLSERAKTIMGAYKAGIVMFPEAPVLKPIKTKHYVYRPTSFFGNNHFYHIIAGAGVLPDSPDPRLRHMPEAVKSVRPVFEEIQQRQKKLLQKLPTCYEYLCCLHKKEGAAGAARDGEVRMPAGTGSHS